LPFKLRFDSTQTRLNNFGQPATIPSGNSAQSPIFKGMSAHYIELAQNQYTQLGNGNVIYKGAETTNGGGNAVDFSQAVIKGDDDVFATIPLTELTPDTYNWLRVSLTYQNFDIYTKKNINKTIYKTIIGDFYISSDNDIVLENIIRDYKTNNKK